MDRISSRRRRGCFDGGGCWAVLGETRRTGGSPRGLRLAAGLMVVTAIALLALPAALLLDGGTPRRSLAERSTHPSADAKARLLKRTQAGAAAGAAGARGRDQRPAPDAKEAAAAKKGGGAAFKGLFSPAGLRGSTVEKEKLLLNLLKSLEQVSRSLVLVCCVCVCVRAWVRAIARGQSLSTVDGE